MGKICSEVDWIGITDYYCVSSSIPVKSSNYRSNFIDALKQGTERYQVDFISPVQIIKSGENFSNKSINFAAAKQVDLLDKYEKNRL